VTDATIDISLNLEELDLLVEAIEKSRRALLSEDYTRPPFNALLRQHTNLSERIWRKRAELATKTGDQ